MPMASRGSRRARSASVFTLAMTKSGWAAMTVSRLTCLVEPRLMTFSPSGMSKPVQVSDAAAARVSSPPARYHMWAKLPISAATRSGFSTVTVRPRSSSKHTAPVSSAPEAGPRHSRRDSKNVKILFFIGCSHMFDLPDRHGGKLVFLAHATVGMGLRQTPICHSAV